MRLLRTIVGVGVALGGALLTGHPVDAGPNAGGGGKDVVTVDTGPFPGPTCDNGETLTVEVEGWWQSFDSPSAERSGQLGHVVYHLDVTFTNAAGDEWVWRDRGPDRFFLIDGVPHIALTGRSGASGVVGRVVVNLVTGEVVATAGNPVGEGGPSAVDAAACDALT